MTKRLLSLLLALALLLCATTGLAEQTSGLSAARISDLRKLAGDNGAQWREGTSPSPDMNAFQMWQWTDWFLSDRVRSLLGAIQDDAQLNPNRSQEPEAEAARWKLLELESTLSRFEAQLEEDRLAILNGISLCQSGGASQAERQAAISRILAAESEIQQIITSICRDYDTYLTTVNDCSSKLQPDYDHYADILARAASRLEAKENSADAEFRVSVLATARIGIRVCDPDGNPIKGAAVTVTNQLNDVLKQAVTDPQGDALFWVGDLGADETGELQLKLRVEAQGYRVREAQTVRLRSGEIRTVELQRDNGEPYLIMGCFNGRDILTEANTYYCTKLNTAKHAFTVKLYCAEDGELELRYPVDAEATEYGTVVQPFTAADSDSTVLRFEDRWLSKLPPGARVSFTIRTGEAQYTTDTLLLIQKAMVEAPVLSQSTLFAFNSGSNDWDFRIPYGTPFIGGDTLSVELPASLPQALYLASYQALYALGYDFKAEQVNWQTRDAEDEARAIKAFEVKGKADEALATAGVYRDINTTTQSRLLGGHSAYVTPFAALQGLYRANNSTLELSGAAGAVTAFRAGITQTFATGPAPFYAGMTVDMGTGFGVDVTSTMELDVTGSVPEVVGSPRISSDSGSSVSYQMDMRTTSGMGVRDDVTVDVSGYGSLAAIADAARGSASATLDMGMYATMHKLFTQWKSVVWADNLALTQSAVTDIPMAEAYLYLDNTGANMQMTSSSGSSYGTSGLEPVETKQLFSQLDSATGNPQYVVIGGDTYVFWIQPGAASGDKAQLCWQNLTDTSRCGQVNFTTNNSIKNPHNGVNGDVLKRASYADYDFAVDVSRGENNQPNNFCALTILSGKFSSAGSGTSAQTPTESLMTTVLMERTAHGELQIRFYMEDTWKVFQQDDYAVMPEVYLTAEGDDIHSVYIASTCSSSGNPQEIHAMAYYHKDGSSEPTLDEVAFLGTFTDVYGINRYCVETSNSVNHASVYSLNEAGELSRLSLSGGTPQRELLAQGNIISFQVFPSAQYGDTTDRLFYLEQVTTAGGSTVYRLKSVTPDPTVRITDYDIELTSPTFDIIPQYDGLYLYWTECAAPKASSAGGDAEARYPVRAVRYDLRTDTAYGPFSLMELSECPSHLRLLNFDTGYYTTPLSTKAGSYKRCALNKVTNVYILNAELTAAVLSDPCVSAGDFTDLVFSVKNTSNVPLNGFTVQITDTNTNQDVQTIRIDLDDPERTANVYHGNGTDYTMSADNAPRRISSMYDPLNQEDWTVTGTTAVRSVHTDLLMPGDTRSYQTKIQIPANWMGNDSLVAKITSVHGAEVLGSEETAEGLLLNGNPMMVPAIRNRVIRLGSDAVKTIDTNAHDLMLSAQLIRRGGEDYVHITLRNRSGNTASDLIPVLTSTFRGKTLFSHAFAVSMGSAFGYSMDIPLTTLTNGQNLSELELHVGDKNNAGYEDFADSDNHVRLLLRTQLYMVDQPESISVSEGKEAVFSVTAGGGVKPYRYQWQSMIGPDQWRNIPDAELDTYSIASVTNEQNGLTVRCVITDQIGDSVTSVSATLLIVPQTGDSAPLMLWLLLALSSAAVLGMLCRKRYSR
ncbi:MAG: carboxypeptidase-like regulatory domain-containing protein [Aristaeellaceae bacterium]